MSTHMMSTFDKHADYNSDMIRDNLIILFLSYMLAED